MLLYAQVTQADGASQRNILLDRRPAPERYDLFESDNGLRGLGLASWNRATIESILASLALPANASLSVLAVELLPELSPPSDPLLSNLGQARILRTSPLTPVPTVC